MSPPAQEQSKVIRRTEFEGAPEPMRGKVRDIYDLGDKLLIVTTDRISAFDVILTQGIPGKGTVLNQISKFWFERTRDIVENHMITVEVDEFPEPFTRHRAELEGRAMLVRKFNPLPVECIVRGYITGSGWKEYKSSGSVCGIPLSEGLVESEKLPEPLFTPSTKAELGEHDENITFEQTVDLIGRELAEKVRETSLALYNRGLETAIKKGIIIADTKFEFGTSDSGDMVLIDEVLTPDSSRFWPLDDYEPGRGQTSFDKQFVRDYLSSIGWNKTPPPPKLPASIVEKTSEKYLEALTRLRDP